MNKRAYLLQEVKVCPTNAQAIFEVDADGQERASIREVNNASHGPSREAYSRCRPKPKIVPAENSTAPRAAIQGGLDSRLEEAYPSLVLDPFRGPCHSFHREEVMFLYQQD